MSRVLDDSFSMYALKILHILSYYDDILNCNLCFLSKDSDFLNDSCSWMLFIAHFCKCPDFENSPAYCSRCQFCTSCLGLFGVFFLIFFFLGEWGRCFGFGLIISQFSQRRTLFSGSSLTESYMHTHFFSIKCINRTS